LIDIPMTITVAYMLKQITQDVVIV
jgi:hypothetical protein